MPLEAKVRSVRDSICGLLRVRALPDKQVNLAIVGTTWCVVQNRYFLTAQHVLNDGNPRNPADQFIIIRAPGNGTRLERFPVVGFRLEDAQHDFAILEIHDPATQGAMVPSLRISFESVRDGTDVLTYGCPAPRVTGASLAQGQLHFQTALVATANHGMVSAQFPPPEAPLYVFNVHWFSGESGGPILDTKTLRVFSVMQRYMNVEAPHGIIAGPRMGRSLAAIRDHLQALLLRKKWW